mmetsp:Transcript_31785/g.80373  ORF Transcript_31785/g.80373 Transcript_31785/m.80373 type:complete len:240 (+) Transcript_31785:283-1002(+)
MALQMLCQACTSALAILPLKRTKHASNTGGAAMLRCSQGEQGLWILGNRSSHPGPVLAGCMRNRGLDDAASRMGLADDPCVLFYAARDLVLLLLRAEFHQLPHDEVAERVARQRACPLEHNLRDPADLRWRANPEQLLDDPASVFVLGGLYSEALLLHQCMNDELERPGLHRVDALLEYIVCMRAAHGFEHMAMKFLGNSNSLLLRGGHLQCLLNTTTTRGVLRELPNTPSDWGLIRHF